MFQFDNRKKASHILETKGTHSVLHITNEGLHYKNHMTPRNMKSLVDALNGVDKDVKKHQKATPEQGGVRKRMPDLIWSFLLVCQFRKLQRIMKEVMAR